MVTRPTRGTAEEIATLRTELAEQSAQLSAAQRQMERNSCIPDVRTVVQLRQRIGDLSALLIQLQTAVALPPPPPLPMTTVGDMRQALLGRADDEPSKLVSYRPRRFFGERRRDLKVTYVNSTAGGQACTLWLQEQ
jgi:anion-transporting  ArsA/GET3 family ATPase